MIPLSSGPTYNAIAINDGGQITGGLFVHSGTPASFGSFGPINTVTLTVSSSGAITSPTAIALILDSGASFPGGARINIDNSGTILSAAGGAFSSNDPDRAGVDLLTNQASGTIGPIDTLVASLDNRGAILGGTTSAISYVTTSPYSNFNPYRLTNSGTISSTSTVATIDLQSAFQTGPTVENSGAITNSGTGNVISFQAATIGLGKIVNNLAGGTISSAGGTAIAATGQLSVSNDGTISGSGTAISTTASLRLSGAGTINGSVVAGDGDGQGSAIDLTGGGRINGGLTLGAGNDTVAINYLAGAGGVSGVTGTVDAGGGVDRLIYRLMGDATIASAETPPTFEGIGLRLAIGSTVTLGSAFNSVAGVDVGVDSVFGGSATLVNQGSIVANGPAISNSAPYYGSINIQNSGSITATLADTRDYAIQQPGQGSITNSGVITANGGNGVNAFGAVTNTGTITASGTAVYDFDGVFTNSGMITSTAGTGLHLSGNVGLPATNIGTITGARIGAEVSGFTLTNSGTIGSSGLGVAVDPYGSLVNQAGGVINGGIGTSLYQYTFNSSVTNAGTINGNVNFGAGLSGGNTFAALDGGVVNGNVILGNGDRFVTSLTTPGPAPMLA